MNTEVELILTKLKIVSEVEESGLYLCDKKHSKILLDYIINLKQKCDYLEDIIINTELSDEIKKADNYSKRTLYKINYQRLKVNQKLSKENDKLKSLIELMYYGIQLNDEQQQLLNNVLGGDINA